MKHLKLFEGITEGPEKSNQKWVTSERPKVAPAPQGISRKIHDEDDKYPKYYVIDALTVLSKVDSILSNNDDIQDLSYSERGLLFKLKCDLESFLSNTSLY